MALRPVGEKCWCLTASRWSDLSRHDKAAVLALGNGTGLIYEGLQELSTGDLGVMFQLQKRGVTLAFVNANKDKVVFTLGVVMTGEHAVRHFGSVDEAVQVLTDASLV